VYERVLGFMDGQTLELGKHTLRFLETPHVHHWDSMMVVEESTNSLFPSDLYLQPGDQPPIVSENLSQPMIEMYRAAGIFAHEKPVRDVAERIERLAPEWIHPMHGGTFKNESLHYFTNALRDQDFGYRGMLLGREVGAPAG
jgi:flavorubredoxin